ncbi:hypothetical protein G7Y89_g708 [Cudoniella acicularis]|uniref:Uncharacterized protein n=1 Tax=Cudoniella acicularis TaxID=354080 RepID=A0A8H4WAX6_9HELO|nr:hypothetical protein G7Y89_g708 [Cudoniella acicularis]
MIWKYAIASHIQDIVDRLPRWFERFSWAERRRQALVGGLPGKDRLPLHVHIRDPYDGLKLRFEEDDFETLVDCLPISAVCRETRVRVTEFCQLLVPHVRFQYLPSTLWSLKPPKEGTQPVVLRNVHCLPGAETLEHAFSQPTTLTVNAGQFKSAEHIVGMVSRFFGDKIQRLVLELWHNEGDPTERAYWAYPSGAALLDFKPFLHQDSAGDPAAIYVTRDRQLHVLESFWQSESRRLAIATHLLKIYEIFHVSLERLPHLEHVEVNVQQQGMSGTETTRLATIYKRDSIHRYPLILRDIRTNRSNWNDGTEI